MNYQLKSHPEKLLIEHLSEVANIVKKSIEGKSFCFSLQFENKNENINSLINNLAFLIGAFHDLGKATHFFQEYIKNPEKPHDQRKNHSLLSALFVYNIAKKYLENQNLTDNLRNLLAIFTFSTVKRHHGKLSNLDEEILINEEKQNLLVEQVQSINETKISQIINVLIKDYTFTYSWDEFVNFIETKDYSLEFEGFSFDLLEDQYQEFDSNDKLTLFYIHQLLYSNLLFADKNDVILENSYNWVKQSDIIKQINNFRKRKDFQNPKNEINKIKNKAFNESLKKLENSFNIHSHIYSLTLPTGIGKTITAFMLADKMRKLTRFNNSKIIINIPFTSIIDQNFEVYADILESKDSNVLLKHHHLADPVYKIDENIASYDESKFLIETWQSDTIVTTFVQFLETLFSCDKTKMMKFAHLANSIILLDEIQTVPYEYWETIRESFKILGEKLNIYFIFISATQPLIFTPDKDIKELVPDYKTYFHFFNRTKLIINKEKISFNLFKNELKEYILNNPEKDILAIVNTKYAARETFQFICSEMDNENIEIYFLTTLITPFERKKNINKIKEESDNQKIVISTQLVEAGVDISVDTVFRQIAPLDSIIQAAGRANRYSEKPETSDVYIFDIDEFKKASNMIYGHDLLRKTENVLKDFHSVEEKDYLKLIEAYFKEVRKQSDKTTNKLLEAMQKLNFTLVDFELIENRRTESVYIQLNNEAKKIWEQFTQIYSNEDLNPWEKKEKFSVIKSKFYDYVINVPIPWGEEHINFDSEKQYNFYLSELENPSQYYEYSETDFTKNVGYVNKETAIL
jgi:CRISPR-associated endonuclease/helicase Cas3